MNVRESTGIYIYIYNIIIILYIYIYDRYIYTWVYAEILPPPTTLIKTIKAPTPMEKKVPHKKKSYKKANARRKRPHQKKKGSKQSRHIAKKKLFNFPGGGWQVPTLTSPHSWRPSIYILFFYLLLLQCCFSYCTVKSRVQCMPSWILSLCNVVIS